MFSSEFKAIWFDDEYEVLAPTSLSGAIRLNGYTGYPPTTGSEPKCRMAA